METLPLEKLSYDPYVPDIIEAYFAAGGTEKAVEMTNKLCQIIIMNSLIIILNRNQYIISSAEFEIQTAIQYTSRVANACKANGKTEMAEEINKKLEEYYTNYVRISSACSPVTMRLIIESEE